MRYLLYNRPTDMRKSFHTLSGIITDAMGQDPCNGNVYIFINRARDRIKLLHWEPGGMVLLEAGTLGKSDSASDNEVCANIEWRELVMIALCARIKRPDFYWNYSIFQQQNVK